jgi:hypothetical protein
LDIFEIKSNAQLKEQLFTQNKLKKLGGQEAALALSRTFSQNAPEWFVPRRVEQYEIWGFENTANSRFAVFIDKETGDLFLTNRQV